MNKQANNTSQVNTKRVSIAEIIPKNINRREATILLSAVLNKSYTDIFFSKDINITSEELELFDQYIKRRFINHEPIAKIIEQKEFYSINFKTTKDTLDPRPETELLIDITKNLYNKNANISVLDLGCGTGCIGLTIAKLFSNAAVDLADISNKALNIAKQNMENLELKCNLINSNWFSNINKKYDLIISNPPYIALDYPLDSETKYDPDLALFAGKDGMDAYLKIIPNASKFLNPNGYLILEAGYNQSLASIPTDLKFIKSYKDLNNIPRAWMFKRE